MTVHLLEQSQPWAEANRRYLQAQIARVRIALERHAARRKGENPGPGALPEAARAMAAPSALERLCAGFGLSEFARDVLLLCAGRELEPDFAALCGEALGDSRRDMPTLGLALAALPEADWQDIIPEAPLRRWRLIEVGAGETLLASPLRIEERALHFLMGTPSLEERLHGLVSPVAPPKALPASYRAHAERIVALWSGAEAQDEAPILLLSGDAKGGKRSLAAAACGALRMRLHLLRASDIPANAAEQDSLARLWEREAVLSESALLIDAEEGEKGETACAFAARMQGWLLIAAQEPLPLSGRPAAGLEIRRPDRAEQLGLWERALGPLAAELNGHLDAVLAQFPLDSDSIATVGRDVRERAASSVQPPGALLWEACRAQARPPLEGLAQRLESAAQWDGLVLPELQMQTLHEIAAHVSQRGKVYETWGFAARGSRGLGIAALFAGPSGTGKTLAAETLANELHLDLYKIDLSQMVSKYIGETEKNLRRIFDAAEASGAVLLFDEADALFGKRSEVRDSHDRYANIEVSYLLQRMEAYRGLAILTTNQRAALDTAFLRRLRFVVTFPFPDAMLRAEIWKRVFPPAVPTEGLDISKLARLNIAGGSIRNIALNAAFLAAHEKQPVQMRHLLQTARSEYAKLEKPLTDAEIGGWL